jgi:CBS domain-containing protein
MKKTDSLFNDFISTLAQDLVLPTEVVSCTGDATVKSVIQSMADKNIGCIVIIKDKKPIGIFTERDIMRKIVLKLDGLDTLPISKVMTKDPVCVTLSTPFSQIMAAMRLGKFRHLIIIDEIGDLRSVISIKDVLSRMTDFINDLKK